MLRGYLTRLSPKYPRILAYMLQASEYYVVDYLDWYLKTTNFNKVENTGTLKYTKKALVILISIWVEYLLAIVGLGYFTYNYYEVLGYWPLVFILVVPLFLPFFAIILVVIIRYIVQKPYELLIAKRLRESIAKHPGKKIAIAGSYGKTTMREILRVVLSSGKKTAAPSGSINTLLGIKGFMDKLDGDEDVLIFELGEYYPGDIARLARVVQPDIGVITGINEAHLKRFGSIDKTVSTIYELADYLGDKPLYINQENQLAKDNARGNYKFYSQSGCGEFRVEKANTDLTGTTIETRIDREKIVFKFKLLGLHLVGSIMAAIELAHNLGISKNDIKRGVDSTKPFSRRLELKDAKDGVIYLDDSYNGNPDGVEAVIDFLSGLKGHRIIYVTSGLVEMGDRNQEVHKQIAKQLIEAKIDKVLLVKTSATQIIARGLKGYGYKGEVLWFDDTNSAYEALPHLSVSGDVVLLQNNWPDQYR